MVIAPVGQTTRHCPQLTQVVSDSFLPKGGNLHLGTPLSESQDAYALHLMAHRTQSPQSMHLFGFLTITGELVSRGSSSL